MNLMKVFLYLSACYSKLNYMLIPLVDDGGTTEDRSRIIARHKGRLPWKLIHQ